MTFIQKMRYKLHFSYPGCSRFAIYGIWSLQLERDTQLALDLHASLASQNTVFPHGLLLRCKKNVLVFVNVIYYSIKPCFANNATLTDCSLEVTSWVF